MDSLIETATERLWESIRVWFLLALLLTAILSFICGYIKGSNGKAEAGEIVASFQKQAIDNQFAQYDAKTGVWRWKTREELNEVLYPTPRLDLPRKAEKVEEPNPLFEPMLLKDASAVPNVQNQNRTAKK